MGGYDKYWPQVYFISVVFALIHYIDWQADKPPDAGVRKHKKHTCIFAGKPQYLHTTPSIRISILY